MRVPNDIYQSNDPADLTPEACLREIVRILAVGYLRFAPEISTVVTPPDLDLSRPTVVSVQRS
jgi:hypothetical protein